MNKYADFMLEVNIKNKEQKGIIHMLCISI